MRIPIIQIGENLIISIQSDIDDKTALDLQTVLTERIRDTGATGVLIEVSALDMVDSFLARTLSDIASMSATMNAITVIVGIQPAIAITLVELGLELRGAHTALNMENGIALLNRLKQDRSETNEYNNLKDTEA